MDIIVVDNVSYAPVINVIYTEISYANNSTVNFGFLGQSETVTRQIKIKNEGSVSLNIGVGGISITNIGNTSSIVNNPVQLQGISISASQEIMLTVNLDTSTLGQTSSIIQIQSDDILNGTFLLNLLYEIRLPYEFILKIDGDKKLDGQTIDIGDVNQLDDLVKTIRITNAGVSKNIRITDISAENSIVAAPKALPFILQIQENNAYQFDVLGNTVSKGKKSGKLNIQWEVES